MAKAYNGNVCNNVNVDGFDGLGEKSPKSSQIGDFNSDLNETIFLFGFAESEPSEETKTRVLKKNLTEGSS